MTETLKQIPLFAGLTDEQAVALGRLLKPRRILASEHIFWTGDPGADFFVVDSGHVVLTFSDGSGADQILAQLGPADFFGELSLLDGGPRTATAKAKTDVRLLSLGRDEFLHFLHDQPAAALAILTVMGQRQREMLGRLRGIPNPNKIIEERATLWQRTADVIAKVSASQAFVLFHVAWFAVWLLYNILAGNRALDPFPFSLLTLIVSLEAIFLSIFVLVSQNRQTGKDRIAADLDYQVNVKAHLEVMELQQKMDRVLAAVAART